MTRKGQISRPVSLTEYQLLIRRCRKAPRLSDFPYQFKSKVVIDGKTGCWLWTGATGGIGEHQYGYLKLWNGSDEPRTGISAHRYAYEYAYGRLLSIVDVAHGPCQTKLCVRPDHVGPLTHQDNCRQRDNSGNGYRFKNRYQKAREAGQ